jgi:hypothetical protein
MDIEVVEEDGEVTGEMSFDPHGSVAAVKCADTDTDGVVIFGAQLTTAPSDGDEEVGFWIALAIREGEPDAATIWFSDEGTDSCQAVVDQLRAGGLERELMEKVEDGDDTTTS